MTTPKLSDVFLAALETDSAHERTDLLDKIGASQPEMRRRVEQMLAAQSRLGDFLVQPAVGGDAAASDCELGFLSPSERPDSLGRLAHYDVLEVIGNGGFGLVLRAFDEKLHRVVAIKALRRAMAAKSARERFVREARAAAAVNHENVVSIYEVDDAGSVPYLVMEFVAGQSLQDRLAAGPLPLGEIVRIGGQIAAGLAAAHSKGLVHRDIKPANILLEEGDRGQGTGDRGQATSSTRRIKITDFGLARVGNEASLTQSGIIAGTPEYMSPEQARGQTVDHRADLFSLGSVLYALCAGRSPFAAEGSLTSIKRVCDDTPVPLAKLRPDLPASLIDLIARLHAKQPDQRPQSAREVADALGAIEQGRAVRLLPRPRLRYFALAAAVVLALALGTGGYLLGPQVYRLVTNQGQLIVETDDPDVKVVVKQEEQEVLIIDAKTQREVTLKAGKYQVELAPGKDGLRLSATQFTLDRGGEQIVRVHFEPRAPQSDSLVHTLEGHKDHVNMAAFCLDGTCVISGGGALLDKDGKWVRGTDFALRMWDVKTGREVGQLKDHTDKIKCLVVSPDGKRAVSAGGDAGGDFQLRYWNLETRELIRRFDKRHTGRINGLAFAADGTRVWSAGGDKSLRLWDVHTGREVRFFEDDVPVWSVAVSRDDQRILTGSWSGLITLWDAETGKTTTSFRSAGGTVQSLSFSPDERLCLTHGDGSYFGLWDLATGQVRERFYLQRGWITHLAYSPDGRRILSCGEDRSVYLWDAATGKEIGRFEGHTAEVSSAAFSPDGRFAVSAGRDKTVRIWKLPE